MITEAATKKEKKNQNGHKAKERRRSHRKNNLENCVPRSLRMEQGIFIDRKRPKKTKKNVRMSNSSTEMDKDQKEINCLR